MDHAIRKLFEATQDQIMGISKKSLQDQNFNPIFILLPIDGLPIFHPLDFSSQESKMNGISFAALQALAANCIMAFFVADIAIGTPEQRAKGFMPTEVPLDDRREAIMSIGWVLGSQPKSAHLMAEYKRMGSDMKTIQFIESPMNGRRWDKENGFEAGGDVKRWFEDAYHKSAALLKPFMA